MVNSFVSLAQAASSTSGGFSGSLSYFHFTLFNFCILFSSGMVNKCGDDDDDDEAAMYNCRTLETHQAIYYYTELQKSIPPNLLQYL